ncbi:MAG: HAD-IA family hydrolase [Candidatus Lokiarchaeota archaeon]|nr:HAD-IA family hydrolase [Candidatus Lokiarchaeota archaeon]
MSEMNNIKTIIFDLGGVYFTPGSFLAIEKIREIYDIKNEKLLREFFSDNPNSEGNLIRKGLMTIDEFEEKLFSKLEINKKERKHTRYIWFGSYCIHYGIEDLVKALKKQYRLLIFSGNVRERIEYLDKKCNFLRYFHDAVFSFDYQKNKDDLQFYEELTKHIECEPSEAILIDDEKKNVKIARSLGFKGIHYYYTEKLIEDLKNYGINIDI